MNACPPAALFAQALESAVATLQRQGRISAASSAGGNGGGAGVGATAVGRSLPFFNAQTGEPAAFCTRCGRAFLEAELFCPRDATRKV